MNIKSILFSLIVFINISVFGQNSFELLISTPVNEVVSDLVELDNGDFLAVGWEGDTYNPEDYKGLIIKIKSTGDTSVYRYSRGDTVFFFEQISVLPNGNFIVFGSVANSPDYSHGLMIGRLDSNLSMVSYKRYDFPGYISVWQKHCLPMNNGFFVACVVANAYQGKSHLFLAKINEAGDTIKTKIFDSLGNVCSVNDFVYSYDSSNLWIFGSGYGNINLGGGSRIIIDTNFNYKYTNDLPGFADVCIDVKWITDSTLLLQSCYIYIEPGPQDEDIGISETDTAFLEDNIHFIGAVDTIDNPAWSKSLDFRDPDSIFIAGMFNVTPDFFPQAYNHILIGQLDRELETRLEIYYGGDAYYKTSNIISTSDGGCLVAAKRYDYMTQGYEHDAFILKLNKDDIITGQSKIIPDKLSNVLIYPNPGHDRLNIKTSLNKATFELFGIDGKLYQTYEIYRGLTGISTNGLVSGIYYYRIISDFRIVNSGNWIKH